MSSTWKWPKACSCREMEAAPAEFSELLDQLTGIGLGQLTGLSGKRTQPVAQ